MIKLQQISEDNIRSIRSISRGGKKSLRYYSKQQSCPDIRSCSNNNNDTFFSLLLRRDGYYKYQGKFCTGNLKIHSKKIKSLSGEKNNNLVINNRTVKIITLYKQLKNII